MADGVGGWIELGIDSGKYSRELCKKSLKIYLHLIKNIIFFLLNSIGNLWTTNPKNYRKKPKNLIIDSAKLTKSEGSR